MVDWWTVTKTNGLSNTLQVQKGQTAEKDSYRDICNDIFPISYSQFKGNRMKRTQNEPILISVNL